MISTKASSKFETTKQDRYLFYDFDKTHLGSMSLRLLNILFSFIARNRFQDWSFESLQLSSNLLQWFTHAYLTWWVMWEEETDGQVCTQLNKSTLGMHLDVYLIRTPTFWLHWYKFKLNYTVNREQKNSFFSRRHITEEDKTLNS